MDERTIDVYNKMAKEYDEETSDFWNLFPRTFLDTFVRLSGKRILNIGSGPGRDGLLLQKAEKEVICLDASEEMVRLSSARGLSSLRGSFDRLPFEGGVFDGVWSYTTLLHVPKRAIDAPMREIYRVLVPSGIFALGLIEGEAEGYRESSGIAMPRWFSFYQKNEVEALAQRHGFDLVYFETFKPRSKNYLNFIFRKA